MKKTSIFILLTILANICIIAQETNETDQIVENFYNTLQNKSSYEAMDNIMTLNGGELIKERIRENLKLRFNTLAASSGDYKGYENIEIEKFANCLIKYYTVAKYSDMPIFITFKFYNPEDKWMLLDLNISTGSGSVKTSIETQNRRK